MSKYRWYWLLAALSLVVVIGSAGGCIITAPPEPSAAPEADTVTSSATVTVTPDETASAPADDNLVGSDPVSGRSQEIDFSWEQLCLSSQYQVQIAKDPSFTIVVIDTGAFAPADSTSPAAYYPAGGQAASPSAIALWSSLEAGHTYYWRARVRQAATGQWLRSPWSEVKSFTVKAGLPTSTPSYGLQPLYPSNTRTGCPVKPASFSWSPLKDTTKYKFILAKDAAMTLVVKEAVVTTTAYEYDGTLDYSSSYFWRVMALEPAPSDWSATFSFQTEAAPPPPAPPAPKPETPPWVWVVIALGAILIIVTLVLIFKVRRR
jgi:hypothetical protein